MVEFCQTRGVIQEVELNSHVISHDLYQESIKGNSAIAFGEAIGNKGDKGQNG